MRRRLLIALPLLAGCSVFPDRPNVPVRRFDLAPRRPATRTAPRGAAVVLLRRVQGVPGLQDLGLRVAKPDGSFDIAVYDQWLAPPGQLAEAALRGWLQASGLFSAVVAPGSRAEATLAIEGQLTTLEAAPEAEEARAALAGVLLRETGATSTIVTAFQVRGRAPLARDADAAAQAAAMEAALGDAFADLERALVRGAR
jgi:ABC-type uncharacterized transport system auxiliary subunit